MSAARRRAGVSPFVGASIALHAAAAQPLVDIASFLPINGVLVTLVMVALRKELALPPLDADNERKLHDNLRLTYDNMR